MGALSKTRASENFDQPLKPPKKIAMPRSEAVLKKQQQRAQLRRRICEAGELDSRPVIEELKDFLRGCPELRTVAVYSALPGEVDLRKLLEDSNFLGSVRWVFPQVETDQLRFFHVRDFDAEMLAGAFGIMEPRGGLEEVRVAEEDLFLCPGLGFDRKGGRVGRGRGFYDRMLARARADAKKFGVCFSFQLLDEVVTEAHDIKMDRVVAG